uniref:Uncharacterized protein n=1 Tax=uncultured bacterium contig00045 TaxID=1181531 RepID=A0A806K087_9BACT|nr:hypothetical protein [uncultured bacterium contig00045]
MITAQSLYQFDQARRGGTRRWPIIPQIASDLWYNININARGTNRHG